GKRLQRHMTGPGHVHEEEALAAEEALRDPSLQLHLVPDGGLHHHHAAGVDDEPLTRREVEVEAIAAAVQAHAQPLGERALDLDLAVMREVRVLLADDLAVELVLADRARER